MPRFLSDAAASRRAAAATAETELTIRAARSADAPDLERLAALVGSRPLCGWHALVAELGGRVVAAVSMHDGRATADPSVSSADVVACVTRHASARLPAKARLRRPATPRFVLRAIAA